MNSDHTDKKGIINKMKNLCLRVDPCPKNLKINLIHYFRNKQYPNSKLQKIPLWNEKCRMKNDELWSRFAPSIFKL